MFCPEAERPQASLSPESLEENDNTTRETWEAFNEDIVHQDPAFKRLRFVAAQSGFVMSSLALLSMVGIENILNLLVSRDTEQQKTLRIIILGATTCVLHVNLAMFTLSLLHDLATHEYRHAPQRRAMTTTADTMTDKVLQEILYAIDINYILGAVTGLGLLWTAVDFVMGLFRQSVFPATVLIMVFCYARTSHDSSKQNSLVRAESVYYALQDESPAPNDCLFHATVVW